MSGDGRPGSGALDIKVFVDLTRHPLPRLTIFLEVQCIPNSFLQIIDTAPRYIHDRQAYLIPYIDPNDPSIQPAESIPAENSASHQSSSAIGPEQDGLQSTTPQSPQTHRAVSNGYAPLGHEYLDTLREAGSPVNIAGASAPVHVPPTNYSVVAAPRLQNQEEQLTSTIHTTGDSPAQPFVPMPEDPLNPTTSPNPASGPVIDLADGLYVLYCSQDCRQTRCRIVVLLSIDIYDVILRWLGGSTYSGWYNWIIPGLPSLPEGMEPSLTYVVPRGRTLESGTPRFYPTMQPIRNLFDMHDRRDMHDYQGAFYLQHREDFEEFTVEQRIQVRDSDQGLLYCAMCTVQFPHRVIRADRCRFTIEVEGGPEGEFECSIEPPENTLPVIRIPSGEVATNGNSEVNGTRTAARADTTQAGDAHVSVSRIEIKCSSELFGLFCLTWTTPTRMQATLPLIRALLSRDSQDVRDRLQNAMNILGPMITPSSRRGHSVWAVLSSEPKSTFVCLCGWGIVIFCIISTLTNLYTLLPARLRQTEIGSIQRSKDIGFGEPKTGIEQSTSIPGFSTPDPESDASEETATPDAEPNASENTTTSEPGTSEYPLHPSVRDFIDYSLGWKGPSTYKETSTPSPLNYD